MKKTAVLLFAFIVSSFAVHAAEKTAEFWVRGNCGSCEKRIEKTLKKIDGVQKAEWDQESGNVKVTFDDALTNQETMEESLAKAGHATKEHKADKKVHDKLPKCCREGEEKHND